MTTAAYNTWVQNGRHYEVARPIQDLVTFANIAGVECLGVLGSDDARHLKNDHPEDHTPFPVNPWPIKLPGYWVCAADFKNGPWAVRLLTMARNGEAPYVKYMNFGNNHYDIRSDWNPTYSSDEHMHVSVRSDHLHDAAIYNPFVRGYIDMAGIARGGDGTLYYVTGMESRIIKDSDIGDLLYTSGQGLTPVIARGPVNSDGTGEWEKGGIVRKGWGAGWAGPVRVVGTVEAPSLAIVEQGVRNVLHNS